MGRGRGVACPPCPVLRRRDGGDGFRLACRAVPRVLIVRGHQVTQWELYPWRELPERFEVSFLLTGSNRYATPQGLRPVRVRALRDLLPGGAVGEIGARALGDRYLSAEEAFASAEIVHGEELSYWFAAEAAKRRRRHGFKLVQTVWETLPLMAAYRNRHARRYRELVLAETDLFLPATERAAEALRLEGVAPERMSVCLPGIDTARFAAASSGLAPAEHTGHFAAASSGPAPGEDTESFAAATSGPASAEHTIVSPGRLVWEKGHHDVLRALAALHSGLVTAEDGRSLRPRLLLVGSGPEERRLGEHAAELGLADSLEIRSVPYEQMPAIFAGASAMVLASLSSATAAYHPLDVPHAFWEEQFGLVLAEALAAGLAIVASTNGAIPEVLSGAPVDLVAPGDWMGIARALAAGPLSRPPGARVSYPGEVVQRYSTAAAAQRIASAYDRVLASR
jgi:glycosyltransferase involved in cell wall biosynthesis